MRENKSQCLTLQRSQVKGRSRLKLDPCAFDDLRVAGPDPLYGMCVMFTPVTSLKSSPERCVFVPWPEDAKLSWPGFDFASAMTSCRLFAGTDGCSTSTIRDLLIIETPTKSRNVL